MFKLIYKKITTIIAQKSLRSGPILEGMQTEKAQSQFVGFVMQCLNCVFLFMYIKLIPYQIPLHYAYSKPILLLLCYVHTNII